MTKLKFAKRFDPNKKLSTFSASIEFLLNDFEKGESRKTKRGKVSRQRLASTLETIIANLFRFPPNTHYIYITRDKTVFSSEEMKAYKITYSNFIPLINFLKQKQYIEEKSFSNDRQSKIGWRTRVRATPKLFKKCSEVSLIMVTSRNLGQVRLKDKNKKLIPYRKTQKLVKLDKNITQLNKLLDKSFIDICISKEEIQHCLLERDKGDTLLNSDKIKIQNSVPLGHQIDFTDKSLYRVFNNNSWSQGGRFYGGWWETIPSNLRPYIRINGASTCELDFSNLLIVMMYHEKKLDLPDYDDFYAIDGLKRDLVKTAVFILLNHNKKQLSFRELPKGYSNEMIIEAIEEKHPAISKLFGKAQGLRLQYKDSIIAERVMLNLANLNSDYAHSVVALPIHDSFIVPKDNKEDLEKAMHKAYKEVMEQDGIKIKAENLPFKTKSKSIDGVSVAEALKDITRLKEEDYYGGYFLRKALWEDKVGYPL